jgi:hypothetical protein
MSLRSADAHTLGLWLSPEYVEAAAREHHPDPVLGAPAAYAEIRGLLRAYARFVAHRDGAAVAGTGLAAALRAIGYVGRAQPVEPVARGGWSDVALAAWPGPASIPGSIEVPVGAAPQSHVNVAVACATSSLFEAYPEQNVALLRGRLYRRRSAEVMAHIELPLADARSVRSLVLAPRELATETRARAALHRARRAMLRAERHPWRPLASQLLESWLRVGLLASPAAAMISWSGIDGWAALVPGNGIPLAVQVGRVHEGRVRIFCTIDHRCWDGSHARRAYDHLEREVARRCECWSSGGAAGSARRSSPGSKLTGTRS